MKELFSVDLFKKNLSIALIAHGNQKTPHKLPYSFHIMSVTTEIINSLPFEQISFDEANTAIACALLHDVLEDTNYDLLNKNIDLMILDGVKALTKNSMLLKEEQMQDSINRLQLLPNYIQMVKLADRITNLGIPPKHWTKEKKEKYLNEAILIEKSLKSPNLFLNKKLQEKIQEYKIYI